VLVVWIDNPGGAIQSLWTSRYEPATGWAAPDSLESTDDYVFSARGVMDVGGLATVIWDQASSIHTGRYRPGSGWALRSVEAGNGPDISINREGRVAIAYSHYDGTTRKIRAQLFD
jgi:hypothetical protein